MAELPSNINNYCAFLRYQREFNIELLTYALQNNILPTRKEHILASTSALAYQIIRQPIALTLNATKTAVKLATVPFRRTPATKINTCNYLCVHFVIDLTLIAVNVGQIAIRVTGIFIGLISKRSYLKLVITSEKINRFFAEILEKQYLKYIPAQQGKMLCRINTLGAEFGLNVDKTQQVFRNYLSVDQILRMNDEIKNLTIEIARNGSAQFPQTAVKYQLNNRALLDYSVNVIYSNNIVLRAFLNEAYREYVSNNGQDLRNQFFQASRIVKTLVDNEPTVIVDSPYKTTLV